MADWITAREASEISGYNTEYLRQLIRAGRIVAVKKGNSWWVDRKTVVEHMKLAEHSEDRRYKAKSKRKA